MDKDFSELVEYLDGKFNKIDGNLTNINQKILTLGEKIDLKADKSDINDLMTAVDTYAKKADDYFQEMVMLAHKVDKLEKWIHQIAEKVGIKLQY